ncbi:exo-alpha-sialidase [Ekhidna sp.]|uniref:exo-alpha-sialidase n=1 Tax=Ekhidna sp. TaxID=2608089 RepID=UPI003C7DCF8A
MKWIYLILIVFLTFCSTPQSEESETATAIASFSTPTVPKSSLPHLIRGADNNLYMSWVEKRDSNWVDFKYAQLKDEGWSEPEIIASGNDWFVNWADYPMLAVDQNGNKIAHFLAKSSAGTYSYDLNLVLKPSTSSEWSSPIIPHSDGTPTEHGFVTLQPTNDGSFLLTWLDGRNTIAENHTHGLGGAMTIRSAVIDMNGNLSEQSELDGRVCDCCQTGGTISDDGAIIIYRDRSVDEVRDMAFVIKKDSAWSQPKLVAQDNWNIAGCPVNGPRVASYNKTVATAWFTSALGQPKVKVAFKQGKDFNDPIIIDETSPIGRVDVAMLSEETAVVSWLDGGDKSAIKYRKVNINGSMSPITIVTEMSESRGSGFPQMEIYNGEAYFAWTHIDGQKSTIQIAKTSLK